MDYCTLFDRNYLTRGLALHASLTRWDHNLRLWVLCLDDPTEAILLRLALPGLIPLPLAALEALDTELATAKPTRGVVEYYFTCTSALLHYLFMTVADIHCLTYIDADLYFFGDPAVIFDEIGGAEIAIIGHRFPPSLVHLEKYGRFNVAWNTFRRGQEGMDCLGRWRSQCVEWCYDRLEGGRFGDQKYLDEWPGRYRSLHVITHPGANLAPWNYPNVRLSHDGDRFMTDDWPLVFYHFHALKQLVPRVFETGLRQRPPAPLRALYLKYCAELTEQARYVQRSLGTQLESGNLRSTVGTRNPGWPRRVWRTLYWGGRAIYDYRRGTVVVV